jgi:uncharacterized protein
MRGLGTVLNVVAIAAGASIGTLLGGRLPERLRDTLVAALGLFTLALGVQQALAAFGDDLSGAVGRSAPLLVLGALLAGGLTGEAVRLEARLEGLGEAVKRRLGGQARFVEGFVLASLVACVGPLAVLGAFADGLHGDLGLLAIAIGLRLLGLAGIRVANLLSAVLLAPLAAGLAAAAR